METVLGVVAGVGAGALGALLCMWLQRKAGWLK
jgi:hypothetical protein